MSTFQKFYAVATKTPKARRAELASLLALIESGDGVSFAGAHPERMAALLRWLIAGMDKETRDRAAADDPSLPQSEEDLPDREAIRRRLENEPVSLSVRLWTGDLKRAKDFYEPLAEALGLSETHAFGHLMSWHGNNRFAFIVESRQDGRPVEAGHGSVVSFSATGEDHVDLIYALALSLGATSVDAPYDGGAYYAASFRDPDGHHIEVVHAI
ncbi:VOC family protein [Methylorubrum sp. SB2]|uniref:VOC family protein n=1 Tax=Methylorubrum subtropicum TaxID=3138812 RepID=UPI00313EE655